MQVSSSTSPSTTSYAVSKKWLDVWLQFVKGKSWDSPGPIDNSDILPCNSSIYRCRNHSSSFSSTPLGNYECLSAEVWNLLFSIYGGGPTLSVCGTPYLSVNTIDEGLIDSSGQSSSDQLSQQSSSKNPSPEPQLLPVQQSEKEFPIQTSNGVVINEENVSNGLDWSENTSNLNQWQLIDNTDWTTNPSINHHPVLTNGNDCHLEISDRGDGSCESIEQQYSMHKSSSPEVEQVNGIYHPVNTSEILTTQIIPNGGNSVPTTITITDKAEPYKIITSSGDFGDYDPSQLLIHKNISKKSNIVIKSIKRGSNKRRRLTPTKA
ncbi:unnamed protein product [Trichobilharzia regenti]|nr:unnamed protein product [Trichobilharzia regenti]